MIEEVERLVEIVTEIGIDDLSNLHATYLITFLRTKCENGNLCRIAESSLSYKDRVVVLNPFFEGVKIASRILDKLELNIEHSDIKSVMSRLKRRVKSVGVIFVVDCFSPIELLTYLTKLRFDGFQSKLLDIYFTNIGEVTRFLTAQAGGTIRGFSEHLAEFLNAKVHDKYSYFDKLVHTSILIDDFLRSIPHEDIYSRIVKFLNSYESILITSDHGYDVVNADGLLYVTHPSPSKGSILKFSNIAMYLVAWR